MGPRTVHAIRFDRTGGPDVLAWTEVEVPDPGPGQARVRHTAVGLNFVDTYVRSGLYPARLPSGLGMEAAGVVDAVGEGVEHLAVGDRVAYGTGPLGAYAEAVTVPAGGLVRVPDEVDDRTAAAIMLKGLTVQYLLRQTHDVRPGTVVLGHAAAGGVGLILGQWAKALGATVIGTASTEAKRALALANGYDHVIAYRDEGVDVAAAVRDLTDGRGVDVVYDGVGADTFASSLDSLRPRGLLVTYGNASGPAPAFAPAVLAAKGSLFVTRPTLASYADSPAATQAMADDLFAVVASGDVSITIGQTFPLADAAQAHVELEAGRTTGSTVLLPYIWQRLRNTTPPMGNQRRRAGVELEGWGTRSVRPATAAPRRPNMDDLQLGPTPGMRSVDGPEVVRLRRRLRVLGALVIATAVAGPFAGAALERRSAPDEAFATASDDAATVPTTVVGEAGRSAPADVASSEDTTMAAGGSMGFDPGHGYPAGPVLEWIGAGSTGGVDVRLLVADYGPQDDGNPFWEAPPGCYATGSYSIETSSDRFAAVIGMERYGVPERPDATVQLVGVPEGDPRWLVVATVDPAGATVVFPDGQSATAIDIGGMAVAAAPAPAWAEVEQGEHGFSARIEGGGSTHEVASWSYPSEEFMRDSCTPPPPSLPDPGEQPGDPVAATEEIRAAITTVFGNPDQAAKSAVVEHPDIVIAAMEAVEQNYQDITSTATMGDLVFTAPDVAFFYFDLDTSLGIRFDDQIGEARLVDGAWVITTESVCVQLRRGGATCEPPA